ncbi:hypothetical protein [Streptomyces sp. NPDC002044]|uniref:hypothetical protein n=1 Tax=Streptomyces sp. NPDC002044 TaxID=3154662 RepID=UPI00332C02E9
MALLGSHSGSSCAGSSTGSSTGTYAAPGAWPDGLDAIEARLADPDPRVRLEAARGLWLTGATDRAASALHRWTEPALRARLAVAAGPWFVRLGSDPQRSPPYASSPGWPSLSGPRPRGGPSSTPPCSTTPRRPPATSTGRGSAGKGHWTGSGTRGPPNCPACSP